MKSFSKIISFLWQKPEINPLKKGLIYVVFLTLSLNSYCQKYPRKEIDIDAFIQDLFNQ